MAVLLQAADVEVGARVQQKLKSLLPVIPAGMEILPIYNQPAEVANSRDRQIDQTIHELEHPHAPQRRRQTGAANQ